MYKIMIVEDDNAIAEVLDRQLKKWDFLIHTVSDFSNVLEQFEAFAPHLVLLDISLPFYDGYHWCREIRKISQTPIIFISSAGDHMSLIMAINLGADDFLAKPFHLDVVTAKIQAVLRRSYFFGAEVNTLKHYSVTLNLGENVLLYKNERLELTKNEFRIMQLLMENKGNTASREHIMKRLWETESFIDDNTLTVNVTRLRRKLAAIGLSDLIATKKGVGYFLEKPL